VENVKILGRWMVDLEADLQEDLEAASCRMENLKIIGRWMVDLEADLQEDLEADLEVDLQEDRHQLAVQSR
jgi:hypothetical protein